MSGSSCQSVEDLPPNYEIQRHLQTKVLQSSTRIPLSWQRLHVMLHASAERRQVAL